MSVDYSQQQTPDAIYGQTAVDLRRYVRSQLRNIRRGNGIEADDVVQEAFLRVWSTDHPEKIKNTKGYLFRTAKNLIIDIGRRRAVRPVDTNVNAEEILAQGITSVKLTPERFISAKQDLDIVIKTIEQLPQNCRRAFCLQRESGITYAKVARELGMSESMVQKHMARALIAIHKALPH